MLVPRPPPVSRVPNFLPPGIHPADASADSEVERACDEDKDLFPLLEVSPPLRPLPWPVYSPASPSCPSASACHQ